MSTTPPRSLARLAIAIVIAAVVIAASILSYASFESTVTITTTVTTSCSSAATQEDPLDTFRAQVIYDGQWNATAVGYSNSATNQVFLKCYDGSGPGWILIADWNPSGQSILNVTVQKLDATNSNLTVVLGGELKTTTSPYGIVSVEAVAVP